MWRRLLSSARRASSSFSRRLIRKHVQRAPNCAREIIKRLGLLLFLKTIFCVFKVKTEPSGHHLCYSRCERCAFLYRLEAKAENRVEKILNLQKDQHLSFKVCLWSIFQAHLISMLTEWAMRPSTFHE